MSKAEYREAWYAMMMKRLDTDEEGVRAYMRENQQKAMLNPNKQKGNFKGGFKKRPELASEAAAKSHEAQRRKRAETNKMADLD